MYVYFTNKQNSKDTSTKENQSKAETTEKTKEEEEFTTKDPENPTTSSSDVKPSSSEVRGRPLMTSRPQGERGGQGCCDNSTKATSNEKRYDGRIRVPKNVQIFVTFEKSNIIIDHERNNRDG